MFLALKTIATGVFAKAIKNRKEKYDLSHYNVGKITGSQQPFFDGDGHLLCRSMEESMATLIFLSAIMHRKVIHVNIFVF